MELTFGIIGLILGVILGTGFLYWLQTRRLGSLDQRLAQTRTALEQAERLNQQKASQIESLVKEKAKTQDSEAYYQNKLAEFEDRERNYQVRIEELESNAFSQQKTEDLSPGSSYARPQSQYEELQQEHENTLAKMTQELELAHQEKIEKLKRSHQEEIEELSGALNSLQSLPKSINSSEPMLEDNSIIPEEPWKTAQSSWMNDNEPTNSALINPFLSNDSQPSEEEKLESVTSEKIDNEEDIDLAGLLAAEDSNELLKGFEQNFKTSFSLDNQPQESITEEVDLMAMLESESFDPKQAQDTSQQAEEELPALFNDTEDINTNEIEDFLKMLKQESEEEEFSMDKNGHESDDKPFNLN